MAGRAQGTVPSLARCLPVIAALLALALALQTLARTATASPASSAATCSRATARGVIGDSSFGRAIERRLGQYVAGGAGPILGFGISQLICADVTRDGRREMIVLLKCCTANTPTPWAIFARRGGAWRPLFRVVSRRISVTRIRVNARGDVVEKLPRYEPDDGLCCPSGYTYRTTRWNGSRFVVRAGR